MLLISISLALLALAAGMLLLDKTRKDSLGNFFRYMSWLIIIISLLVVACDLTRSVIRLTCHHGYYHDRDMEHCGMGMMHGKGMHMNCCEEMMGGKKMRGHCCEMEDNDEYGEGGNEKEMHGEGNKTDSASTKK
jgi:hypothetical protein